MSDTTETFIKMSDKAEEVQVLWHPHKGNICAWRYFGEDADGKPFDDKVRVMLILDDINLQFANIAHRTRQEVKHGAKYRGWQEATWLPRQDQLQEMVLELPRYQSNYRLFDLSADFWVFVSPSDLLGVMPHKRMMVEAEKAEKYVKQFTSMEQLWLAFVMKEKYNKVWDGEKWIESK